MFETAMKLIWFGKISLENGKLVITLATKSKPTLKQLLARVNKENLHDEFDTGLIIGGEIW
jgi:antitoxin component of MazEF toxin-antitoxin module